MTANGLLKEWQKRLRMQDWSIVLQVDCVPGEMVEPDSTGCVSWQESTKSAFIQILDEKYYGDRALPYDFEKTLVHELMHLKMCMTYNESGSLKERIVHQILDDISKALVEAKRTQTDEEYRHKPVNRKHEEE